MPEKFDFRKSEDHERFAGLPEEEKDRLTAEAHAEALVENDKREKLKNDPLILQMEKWHPKSHEERCGLSVVEALQEHGHQVFFVGGYTRDLLMSEFHGHPFRPHDVDVATGASYDRIKEIMTKKGVKFVEIGAQFGILKAVWEEPGLGGETQKVEVEIATFRTEGEYADGRRPVAEQIKFVEDPCQDVMRRDFTVNALLFDPVRSHAVDYVGGAEDIRSQNLRFVGDQTARIQEDKLRMLRYVRFLTRFGFQFSKEVQLAIQEHASEISQVSSERVRDELQKMLEHPKFWSSINNLYRVGLLPHILPELSALFKLEQPKEHHGEGDAYRHTLEVLRSFPREEFMSEAKELLKGVKSYSGMAHNFPALIWSGLFHDLGKSGTQGEKIDKDGNKKITFHKHEENSVGITSEVCRRLKFSNSEREDVEWLVGRHMTVTQFPNMKVSNQKKLMMDARFPLLMLLHLGDALGSFPHQLDEYRSIKKTYLDFIHSDEYKKMTEGGQDTKLVLLINGEDLKGLGLKPGPLYKQILADVEERQLEGELDTKEKAREYVEKKYIEQAKK